MQRLSARVSDNARRGWDRATTRHGSTFTALIEALGLALDEGEWDVPDEFVAEAQRIDRDRFSRRCAPNAKNPRPRGPGVFSQSGGLVRYRCTVPPRRARRSAR